MKIGSRRGDGQIDFRETVNHTKFKIYNNDENYSPR